jgi:hypothetical protein
MIFAHYANQHPLYTYAVYSPRTKRILFRQDCIFLTNFFPMRSVRSREGLRVDGDIIIPYRSPLSVRDGGDADLSFQDWDDRQPLPQYQDHVTGFNLSQPDIRRMKRDPKPADMSYVHPNHPSFGPPSVVKVPYQRPLSVSSDSIAAHKRLGEAQIQINDPVGTMLDNPDIDEGIAPSDIDERIAPAQQRRSQRSKKILDPVVKTDSSKQRKPVGQRWYYEPMVNPGLPKGTTTTQINDDVDKVIHQPGECKVIRWEDYHGCCKPGSLTRN